MLDPGGELTATFAAGLGALQGVAEFLPISSSGHLSLAQAWLGIDPERAGQSFNIVLHAGTLLAVLVVYARDLLGLVRGLWNPEDHPHARAMWAMLVLGSLPLGVVLLPGVEPFVERMGTEVRWVGGALLVTAAVLAFSHRADPANGQTLDLTPPTPAQALLIGIAQLTAVLPGISRSGATIAAALGLGIGRQRAARFSFLLSIPAVGAATAKECLELFQSPDVGFEPGPFAIGFVVSFVVGVLALRGLLRILKIHGMRPFVPYLILVGAGALIVG